MGGRRALLGPADVQDGVDEIDLIPTQVHKLGRPQAVAEGYQDHGGIPVTPAIGPTETLKLYRDNFNLSMPRADFGMARSRWRPGEGTCQIAAT